ncbi:MAG: 2-hydroxyacid dehydrogenase [Sphingobium sp.]
MNRPLVIANAPLSSWLTDGLSARYDLRPASDPGANEAQVLVTTGIHGADAAAMDALPALKLIAVHGVGYDKVDMAHARSRGISVTNTPDVLTDDVADMAVALVLATARRIAESDAYVRAGRWGRDPLPPLGRKVTGARFGILGLGRIGSAIARRLEPFSPHIAYHSRNRVEGSAYAYAETAEALAEQCDFLIVATSGGQGTQHLVDAAVLAALGPEGILINIGRGSTVDEAALVDALVNGRLGGAGLDVFDDEPRVPDSLLALDNVVLQPHQGSATVETRRAMADLVIANVDAFFGGKELPTPV